MPGLHSVGPAASTPAAQHAAAASTPALPEAAQPSAIAEKPPVGQSSLFTADVTPAKLKPGVYARGRHTNDTAQAQLGKVTGGARCAVHPFPHTITFPRPYPCRLLILLRVHFPSALVAAESQPVVPLDSSGALTQLCSIYKGCKKG